MKKLFSLSLVLLLCLSALAGCGKKTDGSGLTKVTLNEVAHSMLYPNKSNIL